MDTAVTLSNGDYFHANLVYRARSNDEQRCRVNKDGKFVYIKYHFLADSGQKQFTADEAIRLSGEDPDYSKRDLWEAIEKGVPVSWTLHIQIMNPEQADPEKLGFDPFDATKVWPKGQFPVSHISVGSPHPVDEKADSVRSQLHEVGKLVLNRNPENFHRDVEQAAFSPGSMVPGIEDSPDPLLNFRMFFYRDAQYHRLGVNWHQVPGTYLKRNHSFLEIFPSLTCLH